MSGGRLAFHICGRSMKVRAVTNGNIIDLPEGHPLIAAGIYKPVEEAKPEESKPAKKRKAAKVADGE
jgi:hypothetical protein